MPSVIPLATPEALKNWSDEGTDIETAVKNGEKWLKDDYEMFSLTANFCYFGKNGTAIELDRYFGAACHFNNTHSGSSNRFYIATENGARRVKGDNYKTLQEPFLKWFLYGSPFSLFILNRDNFETCRDYGFVISGSAPTNFFHQACVMSRMFKEMRPEEFELFNTLTVEKGFDPTICALFLTCTCIQPFGKHKNTLLFKGNSNGRHSVFYDVPSVEDFTNLFLGKVKTPLKKPYHQGLSGVVGCGSSIYGPWKSAFLERETDRELDGLVIRFRKGEKDEKDVYRPPNPFKTKPQNTKIYSQRDYDTRFTSEEFVEVVLPYFQRKIEENVNANK